MSTITLARVYRKILALENQIALNRLDIEVQSAAITALRRALIPVIAHCERLLREKETLRAMIYPTAEEAKLREVNKFMAEPCVYRTTRKEITDNLYTHPACRFAHLHRTGIRCYVCGHLEIKYGDPI